jgi:hypothetical protein
VPGAIQTVSPATATVAARRRVIGDEVVVPVFFAEPFDPTYKVHDCAAEVRASERLPLPEPDPEAVWPKLVPHDMSRVRAATSVNGTV